MSIRLMTIVWDIAFPTQSQKLIALKLADYASDTGESVFPANESLARQAGCDERTVQRTIKAFRACGLLNLIREGGKGPKDTNEWALNVWLLSLLSKGDVKVVGGSQNVEIEGLDTVDNKGDRMSPIDPLRVTPEALRVTPVSAKGDTGVTRSVSNHHKDPSCARAGALPVDGSAARAQETPAARAEREQRWVERATRDCKAAKSWDDLKTAWEAIKGERFAHSPEAFEQIKIIANECLDGFKRPAGLSELSKRMTGEAA